MSCFNTPKNTLADQNNSMIKLSKIKILENSLINKIAAGEVVERPSSVVKELVENAIDAGSTIVTIEINDGGKSLIRVSDNGSGITKEDLKTAFIRHSTSKINTLNDLENVLTFGFRGEALSSICGVSHLEMITKTREDKSGTRIEIHGGECISENDIGAVEGTTTIVRNLFYNTPARRKFLKKTSVEMSYISDIVQKIALGHPEVAIKYIANSSITLQTNGNNDLKTVIYHVYGKDAVKKVIPLNYESNGFVLHGFIGKPELYRSNRNQENFFINGRYIKSTLLQSAVEDAYKTKLLVGKFPVFVLNVKLDPTEVDVNVHPSKLEVRFGDEDMIYNNVYQAIIETLNKINLIPSVQLGSKRIEEKSNNNTEISNTTKFQFEHPKTTQTSIFNDDDLLSNKKNLAAAEPTAIYKTTNNKYEILDNKDKFVNSNPPTFENEKFVNSNPPTFENEKSKEKDSFFQNYKIVGQVFYTYWIIQQKNSLYLIDQHAAHERVLYETFFNDLKSKAVVSQKLLEAQILNITDQEKETIQENEELLKQFGFDFTENCHNEIIIQAVPCLFGNPISVSFFSQIIADLMDTYTKKDTLYESKLEAIASKACRAAIKASDNMSYMEAMALIEKLLNISNPFTCPHGRPTIIEISKAEIEKMFKRG